MGDLSKSEPTEINSLEQKAAGMLELTQVMFRTSFDGLMNNDISILNKVLEDEKRIIEIYANLTTLIVEVSKKELPAKDRAMVLNLTDIICAIEKMAYRCVDLVERIEYKISENLLFSEAAVQEYKELYIKVNQVLSGTIEMIKTKDKKLAKSISDDKSLVVTLVEKSRANHIDRSVKGICNDWAKIRYLDMLDFTGEIAQYCVDIAGKIGRS